MKKILFVASSGYPNPNVGGSNKIIYEILKNIDYSKWKPSFFSYDLKSNYSTTKDLDIDQSKKVSLKRRIGNTLYNNFIPYKIVTSSDFYLKYHFNKREKYFIKHKEFFESFDIIHLHDSNISHYFNEINKPFKVLTIHSKGTRASESAETNFYGNLFVESFVKFKNQEKIGFQTVDAITFPSISSREMFLQDLNITSNDNQIVRIINNGIDCEYITNVEKTNIFERYEIIDKMFELKLLNVAAHINPKNLDLIIKTVNELKRSHGKNVLFINIGVGYLTGYLKSLVNKLDLVNDVKFLGAISNKDVIKLMKSCDILIMPSEKVVFDMVILEALATGITIIASNQGGNREVIINNQNGYLIDDLNPETIALKILSADKQKIKENAISTSKRFDSKIMIRKYEALYDELA